MSNDIKNYYQGIFITETIMGNPNGDFIDNSPRNIDGKVFTTDKCIKYNVRKYIHENYENVDEKENLVFFYPRLTDDASKEESKFLTRDDILKKLFDDKFDDLLESSIDVKMFGGTFSFKKDSKQIYGPIQISYGTDINDAQIKKLQIGAPFANKTGNQTTLGSESVVDDAIIVYDLTINPNNYPGLLDEDDLNIFKEALWYGTNLRKSTSKKTDAKLLMLIKFKNQKDGERVKSFNIGELKNLITVKNKNKKANEKIIFETSSLNMKLKDYEEFIDSIEIIYDKNEVELDEELENSEYLEPKKLL